MPTVSQLVGEIGLNANPFIRGLNQAGARYALFKNVLRDSAPYAFAGGALVALGLSAIKAGNDIANAYGNLQAFTGATGPKLESLKTSFNTAFLSMTQSAKEVSTATADLNRRTKLLGPDLANLAIKEGELARVTGQDLGQTVASTTELFKKWSIGSQQMAHELDQLKYISQSTGAEVNDIVSDTKNLTAALKPMGLSFDQVAQMMANWHAAGIKTAQVAFGLRQVFDKMKKESIKPNRRSFEKWVAILNATHDPIKRLEMLTATAGRSGKELALVFDKGLFTLKDFTRAVADHSGALDKANEAYEPLNKALAELDHAWIEAIGNGGLLNAVLVTMVGWVKEAVTWYGNLGTAVNDASTEMSETAKKQAAAKSAKTAGIGGGSIYGVEPIAGALAGTPQANKVLDTQLAQLAEGARAYFGETADNMSQAWWDKLQQRLYAADRLADLKKAGKAAAKAVGDGAFMGIDEFESDPKWRNFFTMKTAKPKLTDAQKEAAKETKALRVELAGASEQLRSLQAGDDSPIALTYKRFHAVTGEARNMIPQLNKVKTEIEDIKRGNERWTAYNRTLEETKLKLKQSQVELKNHGDLSEKWTGQMVKGLYQTKKLSIESADAFAEMMNRIGHNTRQLEKDNQVRQRNAEMIKRANDLIADQREQYDRLTHTSLLDQASLLLYHKTFLQVVTTEHKVGAELLATAMGHVQQKEKEIKAEKDHAEQLKETTKLIGGLKLKLLEKGPEEEAAKAARNALTPWYQLPQITQDMELNDAAQKLLRQDFEDLSVDIQDLIEGYLYYVHALNIKQQADQDAIKLAQENARVNKELNGAMDEVNKRYDKLTHATEPVVVHSEAVVNMLMNIANGAEYTEQQLDKLWKIFDKEAMLPKLEKHAQLIKQLTQTMRDEFTKLFEDLAAGHKSAFQSIEQDFLKMIQRMAAEYLASRLAGLIQNLVTGLLGKGPTGGGELQGFAYGGYASGGPIVVGERGPELFIPSSPGNIVPNNQLGGGGVTVNMNITATDVNSFRASQQQIAQNVQQTLLRVQRRNG
jgi:hypothetical protein